MTKTRRSRYWLVSTSRRRGVSFRLDALSKCFFAARRGTPISTAVFFSCSASQTSRYSKISEKSITRRLATTNRSRVSICHFRPSRRPLELRPWLLCCTVCRRQGSLKFESDCAPPVFGCGASTLKTCHLPFKKIQYSL